MSFILDNMGHVGSAFSEETAYEWLYPFGSANVEAKDLVMWLTITKKVDKIIKNKVKLRDTVTWIVIT